MGAGLRRPSPATSLVVPAALAVAASCSGDTGSAGPDTGVASLIIPADSIHVIGTSDRIVRVRDVLPGEDGSIWVLNAADPYFVELGGDGRVLHEWGRVGGGPSEFGTPSAFVRHPVSGGVWVYDRGPARNTLVRIDRGAEGRAEIALPPDSLPPDRVLYPHFAGVSVTTPWLRSAAGSFLFARGLPDRPELLRLWSAAIVAFDPTSGVARITLPATDLLGDPGTRFPNASLLLPYPLWDVCVQDGSYIVYDPLRNAVRRFGADAMELESIALPPERAIEVTFDRIFAFMARTTTQTNPAPQETARARLELEASWPQLQTQFAPVFPEYADLRCVDGTVWIQPFDLDSNRFGLGNEWLRIRPGGTMDRLVLPESFVLLRIDAGRIWGYVTDEYGVQSVAWLHIGQGP